MAINFKDLKNDSKNRRIREIIQVANKSIKVFEPNEDDISAILGMQEEFIKILRGESVNTEVEFSGIVIVKQLFPLLTDIAGIDEMSDDEIKDVITNPSVGLKRLSLEIENIIMEILSLVTAEARQRIIEADYETNQFLLSQDTIDKTIKLIDKVNGNDDMYQKIQQSKHNVEMASNAKNAEELANIMAESKTSINKVIDMKNHMTTNEHMEDSEEPVKDIEEEVSESNNDNSDDINERMSEYDKILSQYKDSFAKGGTRNLFEGD